MSDSAALDQIISDNVTTYLQSPESFPEEFLSWLPQFLTQNAPSLSNADLAGGSITPADGAKHNVDWGTGTLTFKKSATAIDAQGHSLGDVPVFLVAFPGVAGCQLGGSADGSQVTINGLLPSSQTVSIPYFWLAIA